MQGLNGIGVVDMNGFEVVPPEYKTYTYDGYDFEGTKENGKKFICQYINAQHQSNPLKYQRMEVTMPTCLG